MYSSKILWQPSQSFKENSNLAHFITWLADRNVRVKDYSELHQWSIEHLEEFWSLLLSYFDVQYSGICSNILQGHMPNAIWFDGVELNYAEHVFRNYSKENPSILFSSEDGTISSLGWEELSRQVSGLQQYFLEAGIKPGDRIAAYLPNIPEATVAFLAANSIGAVWSSCSPDFGTQAVLDRFVQIEPKILIATDGYRYGGKYFDKTATLNAVVAALPTVKTVLVISSKEKSSSDQPKKLPTFNGCETLAWSDIRPSENKIQFTRVGFNHPIWVLYSSGTTGMPKAITHGTGGVLLEQLKYLSFHQDLKKGERCFWFTTTGWMMWNYLQGCLLLGSTIVLYKPGSPLEID
jgi:acetoacetyl-CoA synthetase